MKDPYDQKEDCGKTKDGARRSSLEHGTILTKRARKMP